MQPHQLPALARAIDAEHSVYVRGAIWLYMLTGARRSELLEAKRHDVDAVAGRLRLPMTKSGEEQFLTLSGPALAIIGALPGQEGNPHLFPIVRTVKPRKPGGQSQSAKGHLVNISKAWGRIRTRATVAVWEADPDGARAVAAARAKIKTDPMLHGREPRVREYLAEAERLGVELPRGFLHVRLHDLRRTVGSWLSASGVDLNLVKQGLRHADIATTLTYARLSDDAARPAFEDHAKRLLAAAKRSGPLGVSGPGA